MPGALLPAMLQRVQTQIQPVRRFRVAVERKYAALLVQLVEDRFSFFQWMHSLHRYGIVEEVFESAVPKSLQLVDPVVYQDHVPIRDRHSRFECSANFNRVYAILSRHAKNFFHIGGRIRTMFNCS